MSNKFNSIETLNSLKNDFSEWADKVGVSQDDQKEYQETLGKKLGLVTKKLENIIASFDEGIFSSEPVAKALRDLTGNVDENTEYIDKRSGTVKRYIFT
jgi:hypothetical protein